MAPTQLVATLMKKLVPMLTLLAALALMGASIGDTIRDSFILLNRRSYSEIDAEVVEMHEGKVGPNNHFERSGMVRDSAGDQYRFAPGEVTDRGGKPSVGGYLVLMVNKSTSFVLNAKPFGVVAAPYFQHLNGFAVGSRVILTFTLGYFGYRSIRYLMKLSDVAASAPSNRCLARGTKKPR